MTTVSAFFDSVASAYDDVTLSPATDWRASSVAGVELARLSKSSDVVLDIGIGTGQAIEPLVKRGNYTSIHGIDSSQMMLRYCATKYPRVTLHFGDILTYCGFVPHSFSLFASVGTLEFIENIEDFFARCRHLAMVDAHLLFTFQPLVAGHPLQDKRERRFTDDKSHPLFLDEFFVYCRDPNEVRAAMMRQGFVMKHHAEFVAYRDRGEDINYQLIIAHLPDPAALLRK